MNGAQEDTFKNPFIPHNDESFRVGMESPHHVLIAGFPTLTAVPPPDYTFQWVGGVPTIPWVWPICGTGQDGFVAAVVTAAGGSDFPPGSNAPDFFGTMNIYEGLTLLGSFPLPDPIHDNEIAFDCSILSPGIHILRGVYSGDHFWESSDNSTQPPSPVKIRETPVYAQGLSHFGSFFIDLGAVAFYDWDEANAFRTAFNASTNFLNPVYDSYLAPNPPSPWVISLYRGFPSGFNDYKWTFDMIVNFGLGPGAHIWWRKDVDTDSELGTYSYAGSGGMAGPGDPDFHFPTSVTIATSP